MAGLSGEELTGVYDRLFASAQRNAAPVESLVTLFGRATLVQRELGASTEELLGFTDNVAVALRVAGTDAASASGALLQLSQALGSGTVRAEEFNSIQEGALPVLQAVAAGLEEAGGSVAKLRSLVIDGKVSSEAFFRAFEAGSVVLQQKVANAELTVSQQFVRLQNVLIDTAGRFDSATNASERVGGALGQLASAIESAGRSAEEHGPAVNRFLDWVSEIGNGLGNSMVEGTAREFEAIGSAVNAVAASFDGYGSSVTDAELATAAAEQALVNFSANTRGQFSELQPVVDDFIQQLLEGRGTAESTAVAIEAIGSAGDFGALIGQLGGLVSQLLATRDAAVATAAAVAAAQRGETAETNIQGQRAEQLANRPALAAKPVSISDYLATGGGAGGGGGSGGGRSPADRFAEALDDQQRRLDMLQRETDLRRQLGLAYEENGFAVEKLRTQMDLENEAQRAGLELTPERVAAMEELSSAYAQASVEADQLAKMQDIARQSIEDFASAAQDGLKGFINDLIEGKSATEALGNALSSIGSSLLNSGLSALFGGLGGGNPLGFLFGKGFATGTANTGGRRGEPRGVVHGQEAVIPLPSGGKVPVEVKMPRAPGTAATAGGEIRVSGEFQVIDGNLVPVVTQISGVVAGQQVKAYDRQLPNRLQDIQARQG